MNDTKSFGQSQEIRVKTSKDDQPVKNDERAKKNQVKISKRINQYWKTVARKIMFKIRVSE